MDIQTETAIDGFVTEENASEESLVSRLHKLQSDDFLILMDNSSNFWAQTKRGGDSLYIVEYFDGVDCCLYEASPPTVRFEDVLGVFKTFLSGLKVLRESYSKIMWIANPEYQVRASDTDAAANALAKDLLESKGHSNGYEFEAFVAKTLQDAGWSTRLTSKSGDQGLDVLVFDETYRVAIQCKRYLNPVGNAAIQEIHSAADCFGATHAVVVTTSSYTPAAQQLAQALGVILLNQNQLPDLRSHLTFICPRTPRKERIILT